MKIGDLPRAVSATKIPMGAVGAAAAVPAAGFKWLVIESKRLGGELVVYVSEKRWLSEARKAHPDKVLYFPPEVEELTLHAADTATLQAVHRLKKEFKGWVVPSRPPVNPDSEGGRHEHGGSRPAAPARAVGF